MNSTQHPIRLTALAAAMTTALYAGNAIAAQRSIHTGVGPSDSDNFTMLDSNGNNVGGTNDVATTWDGTVFTDQSDYTGPGSSTANVTAATTTPFFSYTWTAHDIQMFAPGSYSFDTAAGGGNPESGILNVTVGTGQLGMHMLFDWNNNNNIDVFVVLDQSSVFGPGIARSDTFNPTYFTFACDSTVTNCLWDGKNYGSDGKPAGNKVWALASTDPSSPSDGLMGVPMTAGGPFAGFSANFNFASLFAANELAPIVVDDSASTNLGGTVNVAILGNDLDIDNANSGTITAAQLFGGVADASSIIITGETGGTATVKSDGTVDWTNDGSTAPNNSFSYQLKDADGNLSDTATVTISVAAVGSPPTANDDTLAATEDTALSIDVANDLLGNDTDPDMGNTISLNSFTQPPLGEGTITDNMDGTLTYAPSADFNGATTFTYTAIDSDGNPSNTATVTINVAAVNDAPVAQDNSASTAFNTAVTISVLGNDSDVDGDALTVTAASTPANGSTTINGDNTITYTPATGFTGSDSFTYDISDGNGGTDTATVNVNVLAQASFTGDAVPNTSTSSEISGGSNFSMLDSIGADVGGTNDILMSWDGSIRTDTADPSPNMQIASDKPTPFFGFTWVANNVRIFGPGTYSFETCPGNGADGSTRCTAPNPLTLTVGPTQLGMHMLFDWGQPGAPTPCGLANCNIDVVQVVELNKTFAGATDGSNNFGAAGALFSMASVDGNDDGIPGIPMIDGAFVGFNANFNLNMDPQFALPVVTAVATQGGNPTSVIVPGGGSVTVTATAPSGATFDWNSSLLGQQTDAALVSANTNGTTSQTFVFDPSGLADGAVTARVTIRDPNKGNLANYAVVPLMVSSTATLPAAADVNVNGIPDNQDSGLSATQLPSQPGNGSTFLLQSSAGTLSLGQTAAAVGASTGSYAAGVDAGDIGVADSEVENSCVGGCFDYKVTGLTNGATINVVLPLSESIPADAAMRKFANGEWRNFSLLGGDAIASAPGGPGTCPVPGDSAYVTGLNEGDFCIQVTITDGGRNDTDGTANGTIIDPVGVGGGAGGAATGTPVSVADPSLGGGGCTLDSAASPGERGDWGLLAGLLGLLGFGAMRKGHRR